MKKALFLTLLALGALKMSAETVTVELPAPVKTGGMPLMEALANRKSSRSFDKNAQIPQNILSNLLWATWGYNRPGKRTAPTAINLQELDLYVIKADGCWKYDALKNTLIQCVAKDLRKETVGEIVRQPFVEDAPITLAIVTDTKKATSHGNKDFSEIDSGYLSQNIYLYCASAGLATVVRASFPPTLASAMGLSENQRVVLCQCVGYPEK